MRLGILALGFLAAGCQHAAQVAKPIDPDPIDVVGEARADLHEGYSAKRLIGTEVRNPAGEPIGELHDILVNLLGTATALTVESNGVLEIRDRHFRVPWSDARIAPGGAYVTVAAAAAAGGTRDPGLLEQAHVRATEQRMSDLLDDEVLVGEARRGRVSDIVIAANGEVAAIVVDWRRQ
jgi:sporulation protein YlmC with PRC-barrel domain